VSSQLTNPLGQPIGAPLDGWAPPPLPPRESFEGRFARVAPIGEQFASDLYAAHVEDREGRTWTYLPYGPFATERDYRHWMETTCFGPDPLFHVIVDNSTDRAVGVAAYMRIAPLLVPSRSATSVCRRSSSGAGAQPTRCT